jgi:hypothetical protein
MRVEKKYIEKLEGEIAELKSKLSDAEEKACEHLTFKKYAYFTIVPTCLMMGRVKELEEENSQLKTRLKDESSETRGKVSGK